MSSRPEFGYGRGIWRFAVNGIKAFDVAADNYTEACLAVRGRADEWAEENDYEAPVAWTLIFMEWRAY